MITGPRDLVRSCPACSETWVMDWNAAQQWVGIKLAHDGSDLAKALGGVPMVDSTPLWEMWESVFRAHVATDCPHPRLILEMLKGREMTG